MYARSDFNFQGVLMMDKDELAVGVCDAIERVLPRTMLDGAFVQIRAEDWLLVLRAVDVYEKGRGI